MIIFQGIATLFYFKDHEVISVAMDKMKMSKTEGILFADILV